jgi:hypothetical protein
MATTITKEEILEKYKITVVVDISKNRATVIPSFIVTATAFPAVASTITITYYIFNAVPSITCAVANAKSQLVPEVCSSVVVFSILLGLFTGFLAWCFASIIYRPYITISRSNIHQYFALSTYLGQIDKQLDEMQKNRPHLSESKSISLQIAMYLRDMAAMDLQVEKASSGLYIIGNDFPVRGYKGALRWINGFGYVNLWRQLHRAEEALIDVQSDTDVVKIALNDTIRIESSRIENGSLLASNLRRAIRVLSPDAARYFGESPIDVPTSSSNTSIIRSIILLLGKVLRIVNNIFPKLQKKSIPPSSVNVEPGDDSKEIARSTVRQARNAINIFRDDRLEGLALARKYVFMITIVMGLVAYTLLLLAIADKVPKDAIIAASAFFLVGAVVGLFSRLSQDAENWTVLQDHSLSGVRLLYLPMFSGLAAIGGVFLTALVSIATLQTIGTDMKTPTADDMNALQQVLNIFNIEKYPYGVVIAALFGLSPNRLIGRLKQQSDEYRADLKSTEASGTK